MPASTPPTLALHPPPTDVVTVPVRAEDADTWQAALTRGQTEKLRVETIRYGWAFGQPIDQMAVRSSRGELWYVVEVYMNHGRLETSCPCTAGRNGTICKHAAMVLDKLQLWPFPIASQVEMEVAGD